MAATTTPPPKLNVDEFVGAAIANTPAELHSHFEQFGTLYKKKLYHQLTLALLKFLALPASQPYAIDTFNLFVRDFESKLDKLRVVEIAVLVAQGLDNPQEQILLLTSLLTRILPQPSDATPDAPALKPSANPAANAPHVLLLSSLAYAKLGYGDLLGAKRDMDEASKILDKLDSVPGSVRASHYRVASDYYKSKAEYAQYYKHSLLFLACVDVATDLTPEDRLNRAHDLALSALLAETIYNFGELLMHPILDALTGTQNEWLAKLLFVFNEGAIGKFEALAPVFPKEPILHENYAFLRQKICLMALIDAIFRQSGGGKGRRMTFKSIAEETRLPYEEVEHLVMKAMSLKLVKGALDQVDESAEFTWVQPRVLDREQIGALAKRLEGWVGKLNAVEKRIEDESKGRDGIAAA